MKLCYIDDQPDSLLSRVLSDYSKKNNAFEYCEYQFKNTMTYETLLYEQEVINSHILVIDSRLYEECESRYNGVLTGEEFKLILRKIFPFKEVIVISQNENLDNDIISKYKPKSSDIYQNLTDANNEYEKTLFSVINISIKNIENTNKILSRIKGKGYLPSILLEQIEDIINGESTYETLSSDDINKLVKSFNELRQQYEQ